MKIYLARICWNSQGWRFPTGEAARFETGTSYVATNRFGVEEWLFDFTRQLNGEHYGFVEGVHKSKQVNEGERVELHLYTIAPTKERLHVGILRCTRLTEKEMINVADAYEARGWLREMRQQVKDLDGKVANLEKGDDNYYTGIFNIRFRIEDYTPYDDLCIAEEGDRVWKLKRYTLCEVKTEEVERARSKPAGRSTPFDLKPMLRTETAETVIDPGHRRLQNLLLALLQEQYGKKSVRLEQGFVDIRVDHPEFRAFLEVKTSSSAVAAIREGIGQLLRYVELAERQGSPPPRCIFVSPCPANDDSRAFLDFLRKRIKLDLDYWQITPDTKSLPSTETGQIRECVQRISRRSQWDSDCRTRAARLPPLA